MLNEPCLRRFCMVSAIESSRFLALDDSGRIRMAWAEKMACLEPVSKRRSGVSFVLVLC